MHPAFLPQSVYGGGRAYGNPYIFSDFEPSSREESSGNMRFFQKLLKIEKKNFFFDFPHDPPPTEIRVTVDPKILDYL